MELQQSVPRNPTNSLRRPAKGFQTKSCQRHIMKRRTSDARHDIQATAGPMDAQIAGQAESSLSQQQQQGAGTRKLGSFKAELKERVAVLPPALRPVGTMSLGVFEVLMVLAHTTWVFLYAVGSVILKLVIWTSPVLIWAGTKYFNW